MRTKTRPPTAIARQARGVAVAALDQFGDAIPIKQGCGDYSAAVGEALRNRGIDVRVLLGSFIERGEGHHAIHFWIELPTGEWLDPTSEQFGLPRALILGRGDMRRRFYEGVVVQTADHVDHVRHDLSVIGGSMPMAFYKKARVHPAVADEFVAMLEAASGRVVWA